MLDSFRAAELDSVIASFLDARGFVQVDAAVSQRRVDFNTLVPPDITRKAKIAVVLSAYRNPRPPAFTSSSSTYNAIKDLFELGNDVRFAKGIDAVFGAVVVPGGGSTDLNRPAGTTLPDRCFEFLSSNTLPSTVDLQTAFDGALATEGLAFGAGTEFGFNAAPHFAAFGPDWEPFVGLETATGTPAVGGGHVVDTYGLGNPLPAVSGQWLYVPQPFAPDSNVDWMLSWSEEYKEIQDILGFDPHELEMDILPAPTNIVLSPGTNPGELQVTWDDADSVWAQASEAVFTVYYGLASQDVTDRRLFLDNQASGVTLSGLLPGTTYYVAVATRNVHNYTGPDVGTLESSRYIAGMTIVPGPISTIESGTSSS